MERLAKDSVKSARDAMCRGGWAEALDLLAQADQTGSLGPPT